MAEKLGIIEFGTKLLSSLDLDPLYVALWKTKLPTSVMNRWLVAYWCFYHAGLASQLSEEIKFFSALMRVATSGTEYPRGTERRHFRGQVAINSITYMKSNFSTASDLVDWLIEAGPVAKDVMKRTATLNGFGPWISWKVADMLDRLGLTDLQFSRSNLVDMFNSSKQGADQVCEAIEYRSPDGRDRLNIAYNYLMTKLGRFRAPPRFERRINVQEIETILCKWHSHLSGHYPITKDTKDIAEGLHKFKHSKVARALSKELPSA